MSENYKVILDGGPPLLNGSGLSRLLITLESVVIVRSWEILEVNFYSWENVQDEQVRSALSEGSGRLKGTQLIEAANGVVAFNDSEFEGRLPNAEDWDLQIAWYTLGEITTCSPSLLDEVSELLQRADYELKGETC